jgi:hypothetical protein
MANLYKILGQVSPTANTSNTVYTVPVATNTVISTINICNIDNVARAFRIAAIRSGDTLANKHYLAYDTAIPGNDSISLTIGITLSSNDSIAVFANNTANLAFSLFGSEIV